MKQEAKLEGFDSLGLYPTLRRDCPHVQLITHHAGAQMANTVDNVQEHY